MSVLGHRGTVAAVILGCAACGPPSTWRGVSPDHRQGFSVFREDGRSCLEVDGRAPACFEGLALSRIVYSPDSRHLAYPVQRAGAWYVVRDGELGPPVDGVGELLFSPDGTRLAYTAQLGESWTVFVDGRAQEPVDSIVAGSLVFSQDGRRVAYAAFERNAAVAVIDGIPGRRLQSLGGLRFDPRGRPIYIGRDASGARLHLDGEPGEPHDAITRYAFDPDGAGVAYVARDDGRTWVLAGTRRWGPYDGVSELSARPGGASIAFVVSDSARSHVFLDGVLQASHLAVDAPVHSGNGSRWAYIAHDSTGSKVMIDGEMLDERDWASSLGFNHAGDRYAYLSRTDDADVIVTDRGVHRFDMVVDGTLLFVDEGARWAALAGALEDRELFVVVEGVASRRNFDWSAFAGVASRGQAFDAVSGAGLDALRAWVEAEAALMIEEQARR